MGGKHAIHSTFIGLIMHEVSKFNDIIEFNAGPVIVAPF